MLPTLDSHSSAEVVKGSSAPAYRHSLTLQTELWWHNHHTSEHVHTQQTAHITCMYVCLCVCGAPVLPWQPAAVSLFVCPWSRERPHTNAGAEIGTEGGRWMTLYRAFHLTPRVTDTHCSPTCFHLPSSKCGPIVLILLQGGKREMCLICEQCVLRKWLNC